MKKTSDLVMVILSFLLCFSLGAALILSPAESFSEKENRALRSSISADPKNILSGGLAEDISLYCSDQFPLRPYFTELKALSETLLLRLENNGVIFGRDGYTALSPSYGDLSLYRKNLSAISAFAKKHGALVCFAPRGAEVITSALPTLYSVSKLEQTYDMALSALPELIDPREKLTAAFRNGEYVWFKSDHHWTQLGSYLAYLEISDALGLTPTELTGPPYSVTQSFLGSVYSRSGRLTAPPDTIAVYTASEARVVNYDTGEEHSSVYFPARLESKDKYAYFADGNHGHLGVYPTNSEEKQTLLLIKDSFANCLLPFLAKHYRLEVYDLRYFTGSVEDEIERLRPDGILLLCGIDTAVTDSSFLSLPR